jgi:hypothetical protein
MKKYTSKIPVRMKQYNIMLELARDKTSTFYNSDGSQNRGASHRGHFWNGYNDAFANHPNLVPHPSYIHYCIYRAGIDFKAEESS